MLKSNKHKASRLRRLVRCRSFFRRLFGTGFSERKHNSSPDFDTLRLVLRAQVLDDTLLQELFAYIRLSQMLEFRLQVGISQEKIPDRYIGFLEMTYEGNPVFQAYLQRREEGAGITKFVLCETPKSSLEV